MTANPPLHGVLPGMEPFTPYCLLPLTPYYPDPRALSAPRPNVHVCRQVWLATGTDLGGSLRIPASFCGVVGLRPSVGRVPQNFYGEASSVGELGVHSVSGPLARNVPDLALFLDAMAHHHPRFASSTVAIVTITGAAPPLHSSGKRIGCLANDYR